MPFYPRMDDDRSYRRICDSGLRNANARKLMQHAATMVFNIVDRYRCC